jgi:hypothetical protein
MIIDPFSCAPAGAGGSDRPITSAGTGAERQSIKKAE